MNDEGKEFVENFLMHYKSKYYDPVKAHEYYLRTRQLAAKNAKTALTSTKQRDAFAVSQDSIAKARTAESEKISKAAQARIEELNKKADEAVKKISDTLDTLAKTIRGEIESVKLNEIPKDATPRQRAFLENQNRQIRARAANAGQKKYADAAGQGRKDQQNLGIALRGAVTTARDEYSAAIKAMNAKYVKDTAIEKANIRKAIAGAPAKRSK